MPWTGSTFAHHAKALSPRQASKGASIANAILKRSGDEGLSIATAIKRAKGYAAGGHIGPNPYLRKDDFTGRLPPAVARADPRMIRQPSSDPGYAMPNPDVGNLNQRPGIEVSGTLGAARGGYLPHRDDGGMVMGGGAADPASGGILPTTATQNPIEQGMIQRFSGMPLENLQELTARLGPASPMGQMANRVLMQKRMMPTAQSMGFSSQGRGMPRPPAAAAPENPYQPGLGAIQQMRDQAKPSGEDVPGYAFGGSPMIKPPALGMGQMDPPWTRSAMSGMNAAPTKGFLAGPTPGRADSVLGKPAPNSFVIPADVISGLGEGNSLAGARAMQMAMSTGPHGVPLPRGGGGRGLPRPPPAFHMTRGGHTGGTVDVALSHGEYVISPEQVAAIGGGDVKRGFRILEKFVEHTRKKIIAKMKALPGPVKS